jgi:hypothetical protein
MTLEIEFRFVDGTNYTDQTSEFASADELQAGLTKAINSPGGTISWHSYIGERLLIVAANVVAVKIAPAVKP